MKAVLRRSGNDKAESRLEAGDFVMDEELHQVHVRGEEIRLTPKEFELLFYMLKNHGRVLTHRALLSAVWGPNYSEQTEYLRVFLGNLRKKIEVNPAKPQHIRTEPWVGYRFIATS